MLRLRPTRVAVLALTMALSGACGGGSGDGDHGGGKGPPGGRGQRGGRGGEEAGEAMQVEVAHLRPAAIERWYRSSGTLEARRSAELVAVQAAIIEKILVDEGDHVKEGQLLARLDGRALSLQADAAKIELENLEAELRRLETASSVISQEEIDKQRYLVEEARASVTVSRHQAKQTVIRAPFDGTIVTRYVDEGNLATTATPLFHLADLEVLKLPLHLPEKDAASVGVGADVEVQLVDGTSFTAKIERRAPVVDPLTGTVKFTMQATEGPTAAVPGAFARARVLVDRREAAPSLPRTAIFEVEGVPHVFVVEDGKATRREVKLGLEGSERVEILAGLSPEDAVVQEGNAGITDGMPLRPVEVEAEAKPEPEPSADQEVAAAEASTAKAGDAAGS